MDHIRGLLVDEVKNRLRPDVRFHVTATEVAFRESPDFTQTDMPSPVPDVFRATTNEFIEIYRDRILTFDDGYEVALRVVAKLSGDHTPGHVWCT